MKKTDMWSLFLETGQTIKGIGQIELIKAVSKLIGLRATEPMPGDYFLSFDDNIWVRSRNRYSAIRPVVTVETDPCTNCQNIKVGQIVDYTKCTHHDRCNKCGKPRQDWTYAKEPDWAGIGSGII